MFYVLCYVRIPSSGGRLFSAPNGVKILPKLLQYMNRPSLFHQKRQQSRPSQAFFQKTKRINHITAGFDPPCFKIWLLAKLCPRSIWITATAVFNFGECLDRKTSSSRWDSTSFVFHGVPGLSHSHEQEGTIPLQTVNQLRSTNFPTCTY